MFLATANKSKQLLYFSYIGQVRPEELTRGAEAAKLLLAELSPGYRLLVDFSQLDSIGLDCLAEIGKFMDLLDQTGVETVVRVIPAPEKDIGLNILSIFHYSRQPKIMTCATLAEAGKLLAL